MLLGQSRFERIPGKQKHYRDTQTGRELTYRQALTEARHGVTPENYRDIRGGKLNPDEGYTQEYIYLRDSWANAMDLTPDEAERNHEWQSLAKDIFASFGDTRPGSMAHRRIWERKHRALQQLRDDDIYLEGSESHIYSPEVTR